MQSLTKRIVVAEGNVKKVEVIEEEEINIEKRGDNNVYLPPNNFNWRERSSNK